MLILLVCLCIHVRDMRLYFLLITALIWKCSCKQSSCKKIVFKSFLWLGQPQKFCTQKFMLYSILFLLLHAIGDSKMPVFVVIIP